MMLIYIKIISILWNDFWKLFKKPLLNLGFLLFVAYFKIKQLNGLTSTLTYVFYIGFGFSLSW